MYKLLKLAFISLLMLCFSACQEEDPIMPPEPQTAEKTIFVFMPYSNNLYSFLHANINDMKAAIVRNKGLDNTRLIVFIAKDKKQSALIDIRYKKGVCTQDTLEKYSSPTYLTTNGRVELFNKVKKYAPANRYAMIVGCHGMGWIPSSTVFNRNTLRYFGGLEKEYKIDIDDFATSIKAAGMKMQFIMFDDCYMSSMEVAYDLKDVTDYIIASTSEVMAYGMPYQNIYQHLMSAQPDYKALCNGFYEFYSNSGTPYGTIGVTDCRYMDEMVAMMKSINATHTFDLSLLDNVQDLDGETYKPTIFFDFDDYVRQLCTNDNDAYEQFHNVLLRLVPYKAATEYIYSGSTNKKTKVDHFSGITISDPSTRQEIAESKRQTNWWIQTH
ncbi:clostripain-related cysteine peptidase [Leyella stercorea]|jgi:hypothetical protein|uniref:clostripain-related cysteine peptidase n=1 Tax=Leyella stercorea TaxID=363265 RepID=UPI002430ADF5|nr:clostripain-related cysteine peptidase [Leyella stercorea]